MTGGFVYIPDDISLNISNMVRNNELNRTIEYFGAYEWLHGVYNSGKPVLIDIELNGDKMTFIARRFIDPGVSFAIIIRLLDVDIDITSLATSPNTLTISISPV